ncbi:MAG: DUF1015 domain-containing protein [Actinomycetota bacterium]|nr:DUF1015 domain-containing protein [Actinomycetota bacterium]
MPVLRPFHGIRYAERDTLRDLTCPPYDVISPEEQHRLHELHPHNAIRLELARAGSASGPKYEHVADTFATWLRDGVLRRDEEPALYVYRQDFVAPDGVRRRVAGVIGALELEDFGTSSGVLPHERTMAGPKEDRLALLRALAVNVSPIYGIYRGKGELGPFFDSLEHRPTEARFVDGDEILHRLWAITGPAEIDMLAGAVATGPLVIADGHHRYETALAYHRESAGEAGDHDAIMCFCVDADNEGLVVLPYNRAVRSDLSPEDIATVLYERYGGHESTDPSEPRFDHSFVFLLGDRRVAAGVSDADVVARTGDRHPSWLALDVVALHEVLLPEVFGERLQELRFSRDPQEIEEIVAKEGWTGILLRALEPTEVVDVATSGERMPQKASYFWPKALTGLVFRSLR